MDLFHRLVWLSKQTTFDFEDEINCPSITKINEFELPVTQARLPNGKPIKLLKTMLTSACERNCNYCAFRAGRNIRRITFKPEEMARIFIAIHQAGVVTGLFLSSGVLKGGINTQDKLIETTAILRNKYHFNGYIHLKIMPGVQKDQIVETMRYADRVSINLEAPNPERLTKLAPMKSFHDELFKPLQWINEIRKRHPARNVWKNRWPSSATQFVIGGVGESDQEILETSEWLFQNHGITRAFYSRFNPILDTPLENHLPATYQRQQRLYQAGYLLRDYGYSMKELPFDGNGNLPENRDPKLVWAQENLYFSPIEINTAIKGELLRIPGIGPRCVNRIVSARRERRITDLSTLSRMGIIVKRAAPFITLNGKRPKYQLSMFS